MKYQHSNLNASNCITIIFSEKLETQSAARNRAISFIKEFINYGYSTILISGDSNDYILFEHSQFTHLKVNLPSSKISTFFKRGLIESKNCFQLLKLSNSINSSVLLISIPSMFLLLLSFIANKPKHSIIDIRDLSWEYLSEQSLSTKLIKQLFRIIAKFNLYKFKIISVTNPHEYDYIHSSFKNKCIVKIPNGVTEGAFKLLTYVTTNNTSKKTITYVGNIGLAQDLTTLLYAAQKLPQYYFNIVGDGTDMPRIRELSSQLNLTNIKLWGRQNFDQLIPIYSNSDILYAQLTSAYDGAMPSKLYEYLATGKFILFGGKGVAASTLAKFNHTKTIDSQNIEMLVTTIFNLLSDSQSTYLINRINHENRNFIENNFIREKTVKDLFKFL